MTENQLAIPITDLHTHLMPGVDDGAQNIGEALGALRALINEGVERVVATPHFQASLLERSSQEGDRLERFDRAYDQLTTAASSEALEIKIERGCEFKLDAPTIDLSDPRLRLAGSRYALVEFASFRVPPFAERQLLAVHEAGWIPVLAHTERYAGVASAWDRVEEWVRQGTLLQVNARSLFGSYGPEAQFAARELLRLGWLSCLASDFHARGRPGLRSALHLIEGGAVGHASVDSRANQVEDQDLGGLETRARESQEEHHAVIRTLVHENPERIISDEPTVLVPPIDVEVPELDRRTPRRRWFR